MNRAYLYTVSLLAGIQATIAHEGHGHVDAIDHPVLHQFLDPTHLLWTAIAGTIAYGAFRLATRNRDAERQPVKVRKD